VALYFIFFAIDVMLVCTKKKKQRRDCPDSRSTTLPPCFAAEVAQHSTSLSELYTWVASSRERYQKKVAAKVLITHNENLSPYVKRLPRIDLVPIKYNV
jgi:hypothetical protein